MITVDQDKLKKGTNGYLGKLRSNFLGTEFYLYDNGDNPKKAKSFENIRTQQGVVEYEKNVLGSKGPRRMKVLLPKVQRDSTQAEFKSADVKFFAKSLSLQKNFTIENQFKGGNSENLMFFFNKPPKWNECIPFLFHFSYRGASLRVELQWES